MIQGVKYKDRRDKSTVFMAGAEGFGQALLRFPEFALRFVRAQIPTAAPTPPRFVRPRRRSALLPGTLRVPWVRIFSYKKHTATAKAVAVCLAGAEGFGPSARGF